MLQVAHQWTQDTVVEGLSELEDRSVEISPAKKTKTKNDERTEWNIQKLWESVF